MIKKNKERGRRAVLQPFLQLQVFSLLPFYSEPSDLSHLPLSPAAIPYFKYGIEDSLSPNFQSSLLSLPVMGHMSPAYHIKS
jgi:hypothetical protein